MSAGSQPSQPGFPFLTNLGPIRPLRVFRYRPAGALPGRRRAGAEMICRRRRTRTRGRPQ